MDRNSEVAEAMEVDDAGEETNPRNGVDWKRDLKPSSFGMARTYSSIDISADKWLMVNDPISLSKLQDPPSLADGLSREMERVSRVWEGVARQQINTP